ncbi:cell division protein SepF [Candidatus Woesearchaeota archaeon]|nr:cell division protein SepF [Candidatus Woesearchaeota archaeon]
MANLVSRFVQKIFLDDARQEDVAEEATKQQNDVYVEVANDVEGKNVKNDNNMVKLELNSSYTILRPEYVKEVLDKEKEKKQNEDDAPVNPSEFKRLPKSHRVKFFTLGKVSDYETIAAELYTQDLIGLVNINPLKQHSQPLVVNVLTKFKGLTQEINGDIGALRNGWIIVTPNNVEVYKKKETSMLQEKSIVSQKIQA